MRILPFIFQIVILLSFISCRTVRIVEQVPVEVDREVSVHDTMREYIYDSIFETVTTLDSTFIESIETYYDSVLNVAVMKITNSHIRNMSSLRDEKSDRGKEKIVFKDSIVEKPVYITKTVEKETNKLTRWQSFMYYSAYALYALILFSVVTIIRNRYGNKS